MPEEWNIEQVKALAPDASSLKAGEKLASARKWVSMGRSGDMIWGFFQGSGKNPYQTSIDLSEPAFKCTCPSRKFPCKHGLGLFLTLAQTPQDVPESEMPDFVKEWLEKRQATKERKEAKVQKEAEVANDPEAMAKKEAAAKKRAASRESNVLSGLQELETWLKDLVRQGLSSPQVRTYDFWDSMAKRMVDCQAPGIARVLRECSMIQASGEAWQKRLLEKIASIYLSIEASKRLEKLGEGTRSDWGHFMGETTKEDEVLSKGEHVQDRWFVMGRFVSDEDKLRVQKTWLFGKNSKRYAMILEFAYGNQALDITLHAGRTFMGTVVYYPGNYPQRAIIKEKGEPETGAFMGDSYFTITSAIEQHAKALASNPWMESSPFLLNSVHLEKQGVLWRVKDRENLSLPLYDRPDMTWPLLAMTGGQSFDLFGEWDHHQLIPLAIAKGEEVRDVGHLLSEKAA